MKKTALLLPSLLLLTACGSLSAEAELKQELAKANYCDTSADCELIGSKCPFDCYVYVNAAEAGEMRAKLDAFPSECVYSCVRSLGVACEENVCVPILDEPGNADGGEEEENDETEDGVTDEEENGEDTGTDGEENPDLAYCETDSDCVGATCCHPNAVVNREYAPDCSAVLCTLECSGPLDCGCGRPACENNRCTIVKESDEAFCG